MHELPRMALIATRPGPVRNSLFSLLTTLPAIDLVAESKDADSLLRLGWQIEPDLVVIEANLAAERLRDTLRFVRANWQASGILVLVDSIEQEREAVQAGADAVLFSGCRAAQLMVCLELLLDCPVTTVDETAISASSL